MSGIVDKCLKVLAVGLEFIGLPAPLSQDLTDQTGQMKASPTPQPEKTLQ